MTKPTTTEISGETPGLVIIDEDTTGAAEALKIDPADAKDFEASVAAITEVADVAAEALRVVTLNVDEALIALRAAIAEARKVDEDEIVKLDISFAANRETATVRSLQSDRSLRSFRVALPKEATDAE